MTAGRTKIRWLVLALIILASGVAYVLRTNVSVIGESMMTDLGMNELQLGMIFSAFAAGYAIFQFPGGIFGEKTGARFALTAAAVAWGVLTLLTALVPGSDRTSVGTVLSFPTISKTPSFLSCRLARRSRKERRSIPHKRYRAPKAARPGVSLPAPWR